MAIGDGLTSGSAPRRNDLVEISGEQAKAAVLRRLLEDCQAT
ncbi:MAG: hypothetical protein NTZ53_09345 [Cyanobacteria bacterium]|nr:hypothetical protein [Cyanobacteriota bacterium]